MQTGVGKQEGLDVGLAAKQRFQRNAELHTGSTDERVALKIDGCEPIGLEVEHGSDADMFHAHLHAQGPGHFFARKIHRPPLNGGQIDEDAEKAHQKHRRQHNGTEELEESSGSDAHGMPKVL